MPVPDSKALTAKAEKMVLHRQNVGIRALDAKRDRGTPDTENSYENKGWEEKNRMKNHLRRSREDDAAGERTGRTWKLQRRK